MSASFVMCSLRQAPAVVALLLLVADEEEEEEEGGRGAREEEVRSKGSACRTTLTPLLWLLDFWGGREKGAGLWLGPLAAACVSGRVMHTRRRRRRGRRTGSLGLGGMDGGGL